MRDEYDQLSDVPEDAKAMMDSDQLRRQDRPGNRGHCCYDGAMEPCQQLDEVDLEMMMETWLANWKVVEQGTAETSLVSSPPSTMGQNGAETRRMRGEDAQLAKQASSATPQ